MADTLIRQLLAGETDPATKKLTAAVGRLVFDGGGTPVELFELDLCRRLGWTLNELDEQDAARVLTGLHLQNTRDNLNGIMRFLASNGEELPSDDALKTYEEVKQLMEGASGRPDETGDADRPVPE